MHSAPQSPSGRRVPLLPPGPLVRQGFDACRAAEGAPAELTVAVLSFHIAVEQICRQVLSQHVRRTPQQREDVLTEAVRWRELVDAMRDLELASPEEAALMGELNGVRNGLCHQDPVFGGSADRVLAYGNLAEQLLYRFERSAWPILGAARAAIDDATFAAMGLPPAAAPAAAPEGPPAAPAPQAPPEGQAPGAPAGRGAAETVPLPSAPLWRRLQPIDLALIALVIFLALILAALLVGG